MNFIAWLCSFRSTSTEKCISAADGTALPEAAPAYTALATAGTARACRERSADRRRRTTVAPMQQQNAKATKTVATMGPAEKEALSSSLATPACRAPSSGGEVLGEADAVAVPDVHDVGDTDGVPDVDGVPVGVVDTVGVPDVDGVEVTPVLPEGDAVPDGELDGEAVGDTDGLAEHSAPVVGRTLCTTSDATSSRGYTMEWARPGCSQSTAPTVAVFPRPISPLGDAPQHTTAPTRSMAQVCVSPADTDATWASWGMRTVLALTGVPPAPTSVVWPYPRRPSSPSPQHARVKSSSTAHVCSAPADTSITPCPPEKARVVSLSDVLALSPPRAVSSPYPRRPEPPAPKQTTLPSSSSTQVCSAPQVACTAVRPGGSTTMGWEPGVWASPMSAAPP